MPAKSSTTQGSSPMVQPSCPGGIETTSPGPMSSSVPSSIRILWRPEITYPTCAAWQLSVPAIGFTWSDHFQPGWNVARPTTPPPTLTSSTPPAPCHETGASHPLRRSAYALLLPYLPPRHSLGRAPNLPQHVCACP